MVGDVVVVEVVVVIDSSTVVGSSLVLSGGGVGSGSFVGSIVDGSTSVVNCVVSGTRVLDFWIEDCEKKITFKQKNVFFKKSVCTLNERFLKGSC